MRIAVISDTHGNLSWMDKAGAMLDSVDCIIHLGDNVQDAKKIEARVICPVHYVAGNGDILSSAPHEFEGYIGGVKFFAVHGHRYSVDYDLYTLSAEARSREARVCLYGHTHISDISNCYGIWFVNPGSTSRPRGMSKKSYAIINIDRKGEIIPDIITLD